MMNKLDFKELSKRYSEAKKFKDFWLDQYNDFYRYVSPDRNAFNVLFNYKDNGRKLTEEIYDTTALEAAYQRANDFHGLLLPKDRRWGGLTINPQLKDHLESLSQYQLDKMLHKANECVMYYLNESNLDGVVAASFQDLNMGTAAILVESPSQEIPLNFYSIPAITLAMEYTSDYVVNNCWFTREMLGADILKEFPDYNGKMLQTYKDNLYKSYQVIYGNISVGMVKGVEHYAFYAVSKEDQDTPLFEGIYDYKKVIVFRDRVRPGEVEGRGIALDMLPTIRDLNRLVKDHRKSFATKAQPLMFYDANSGLNPYMIRDWSGAMIPKPAGSPDPISALQMPETPEVFEIIQNLQETIKSAFLVDVLGDVGASPNMSATEASIREQRAQRTASTDIARLINELPKQLYYTALQILKKRNLLPIKNSEGLTTRLFKFDYSSPLYDIQKQTDLRNFVQNLQFKQQYFGEGAVLSSVNIGKVQEALTNWLNLDPDLFVDGAVLQGQVQKMVQGQQQTGSPQPQTEPEPLPQNSLGEAGASL